VYVTAISVASDNFQTCQGSILKIPRLGQKTQGVRKHVFIIKIFASSIKFKKTLSLATAIRLFNEILTENDIQQEVKVI